ncbi:MAG: hypothetical protein A2X94_09205 [Bdellovibrionales bacterium GWB1_55_8]|nr:MAG: hypothetical protein A2X94_09205 [Bdellovibrionales bacterium GWB1_55_8]
MESLTTIRPELLTLSSEQFSALMPYFWVFGATVLAILAAVMRSLSPKWPVITVVLTGLVGAIVSVAGLLGKEPVALFNGMMVSDNYTHFFSLIFLISGVVTVFASIRYLDNEAMQHPEYYLLVLFSALGMMLMASSLNLIVIFIALELMSLAVYILVGYRRTDRRSNEAAVKYFVLGSGASAVLLYGAALLYGSTGSIGIRGILDFVRANPAALSPTFTLGAWLVIIGFLFKVAAVPFHMWMPDVYEGAPTPVTGFMATGLKAAAFAAFLRVFVSTGYGAGLTTAIQTHLHDILWMSAVLTMLFGNLVALTQTNLKRMLAYSSIAHTGYLLVGMIAGPHSEQGYAPLMTYLVAYAVMNLGAFVVLSILATRDDGGLNLHDFSGLSRRHPWLAFAMAVFLFSLAGIPPTAGFAAKYILFYSAVQANEILLVVISVLCSAISVYYYLRVLVYMYMRDPVGTQTRSPVSVWSAIAVAAMVAATLQIGVMPARVVYAAKKAITSI